MHVEYEQDLHQLNPSLFLQDSFTQCRIDEKYNQAEKERDRKKIRKRDN